MEQDTRGDEESMSENAGASLADQVRLEAIFEKHAETTAGENPRMAEPTPEINLGETNVHAVQPASQADWEHLEAIFQKHAEKTAGEDPRIAEPTPEINLGETDAHAIQPPQPQAKTSDLKSADPGQIQARSVSLPYSTPQPVSSRAEQAPSADPGESLPISGLSAETRRGQTEPRSQPTNPPAAEPFIVSPSESSLQKLMGEKPVTDAQNKSPFPTHQPKATPHHPPGDPGELATLPIQALPLQAAWPVQQQEALNESEGERQLEDWNEKAGDYDPAGDHQKTLTQPRQPSSSQASDTPIEVVPPSRPRQSLIEAKRKPGVLAPSEEAGSDDGVTQPKPFEKAKEQTEEQEDEVPTAIGPLPGDLWDLIGQSRPKESPTPASRRTPAPTPEQDLSTPAAPQPSVGSAPLPEVNTLQTGLLATGQPTVIQRQPAGEEPTGTTDQATRQYQNNNGWNEMDLDKLAGQVYTEIKRRFAVEKEMLHRFGS